MTGQSYVLDTAAADRWRSVVSAGNSVYHSVEYARICERQAGCPARLFVHEQNGHTIAYVYFLRPVSTLPFAPVLSREFTDTFTPEYSGPIERGPSVDESDNLDFPEHFGRYCRDNGIVAEFAHLSPWKTFDRYLDPACIETNREIVYIDLDLGKEGIWSRSLSSDCRRQTKQAQRAGVRVRRAVSSADVEAFYQLYTNTMDRRNALDRYYFPLRYFLEFFHDMPANAHFVLAEYQERVVAGGLFLEDDQDIYWQLSAVDLAYSQVRPVNLYVYEAICAAIDRGRHRMILGGGYQPDDGVFRYKSNFSPLRARFCTYKRVHDPEIYSALTRAWRDHHQAEKPGDFFPAYRSPPPNPAADTPVNSTSEPS